VGARECAGVDKDGVGFGDSMFLPMSVIVVVEMYRIFSGLGAKGQDQKINNVKRECAKDY
jgi:hypothetical protein